MKNEELSLKSEDFFCNFAAECREDTFIAKSED